MVIQPAFAPLSCDFSAQFPGFSLLETLHVAWPNFHKQDILLCRRPWHFTELYLRFDPVDPRGLHCGRGVPTRFGPSQLQFFSSVPRLFSAGNIARYLVEFFCKQEIRTKPFVAMEAAMGACTATLLAFLLAESPGFFSAEYIA